MLITSSAIAACSTDTCSSVRLVASMVVAPELLPVHLTEALESLELELWSWCSARKRGLGGVVLQVDLLLPDHGGVQRRLGDEHVAGLDQRLHLAEEEREQQRADVAAVDVGVAMMMTLW